MLRTNTINTTISICIIIVLTLSSQPILAQPGYNNQRSEQADRIPRYSPLIRLQRLIRDAEIYEYLLSHPNIIKLQDMAQRVWDKQTGNKRRVVTWSRRNIISPDELPVRKPYQ